MSRRKKVTLAVGGLAAAAIVLTGVVVAAREPSLTRTWDEDVGVLSGVTRQQDGSVRLEEVRNWRYAGDSILSKEYISTTYLPEDVQGLWLYEQELGLGGRIAHTFLVFEFPERYGDRRWLGLSVETRRELGETYSLVGGMLRAFELTHIWAHEEDLVTRRVDHLDYPLTRYRVRVTNEQVARIFRRFTDETASLASDPRWYHTLSTNCTSTLIAYVNDLQPGAIPWHYSFVLTGRTDDYLARLGYLDIASAQSITLAWLGEHGIRPPGS